LAAELCEAADVDRELLPKELEESEWKDLFREWKHWLDAVASGQFTPSFQNSGGRISMLGFGQPQGNSVLEFVDTTFRSCQVSSKSMYLRMMMRHKQYKFLFMCTILRQAL
jgi:hypothetical protein